LERDLCQLDAEPKRAFLSSLFGWSKLGFSYGEELGEFLAGLAYDRTPAGSYRPNLRFSGYFTDQQMVEKLVSGFFEASQQPPLETEILLGKDGLSTAVDYYRHHRDGFWNDPIQYQSSGGYQRNKGAIILTTSIARSFVQKGVAQYFPEGSMVRADLHRFIQGTVCEIILTSSRTLQEAEELASLGIADIGSKKWDRPYKPLLEMWNKALWPVGPVRSRETGQFENFAVYYFDHH